MRVRVATLGLLLSVLALCTGMRLVNRALATAEESTQ